MPRKSKYGRPIAFHRSFVGVTGSVNAAIMLSQAVYWSERTDDPEGWFWKTQEQWEDETGLSRYEQESGRKALRNLDFWHEERRGIPAKMYYRVDDYLLDRAVGVWVEEDMASEVATEQRSMLETSEQDWGEPTVQYAEKPQSRMGQSSEQDRGKAADILYTESTPENTSKTTAKITPKTTPARGAAKQLLSQKKGNTTHQPGLEHIDFGEVDTWLARRQADRAHSF